MEELKKVLLVDDDPISNFLTKAIVEESANSGVEIDIALNGMEALELIQACIITKSCPIYIFLDINMPIMNGFEFLAELEHINVTPPIRIIILSSSRAEKDLRLAMNYKIIGYLSKPLTQEKLKSIITNGSL